MTFDLSLRESAGSRSLHRLVRIRSSLVKLGILPKGLIEHPHRNAGTAHQLTAELCVTPPKGKVVLRRHIRAERPQRPKVQDGIPVWKGEMNKHRCSRPLDSGKECPGLNPQLLTLGRPRKLGNRLNECLVIGLAPEFGTRRLPRADREKLLLREMASPLVGREYALSDGIRQRTVSLPQFGKVLI